MPNIRRQDEIQQKHPRLSKGFNCNCQVKATCPMPGKCNTDKVVYSRHLTWQGNTSGETKKFQKRYGSHKHKIDHEDANHTTLISLIWTHIRVLVIH